MCGYSANGDRATECQNGTWLSLDEIAQELNMSKRNLQRALRIERNLTDSMKELLDDGEITKKFASDIKQPIQIQNSSKKEKALYAIIILPMHNLTPLAPDNAIQGLFICLENVILSSCLSCIISVG